METTAVTPELVIRAVLELLFLLAVLGFFLFFTDLRKRLYALGAGALVVVFVFIGAWGVVQMVDRWQYDYPQKVSYVPFARFAMYQAQVPSSVEATYEWRATDAEGRTQAVNIADEFSAVGLPPMSTRMRVLMEGMVEPAMSDEHTNAERELELYAEGLLSALDAKGERITELGFFRVEGTPDAPRLDPLISWSADELRAIAESEGR